MSTIPDPPQGGYQQADYAPSANPGEANHTSGYHQPSGYPQPGVAPAAAGGPHWSTWLALGAGLITLVASFLNFWNATIQGVTGGITGWSKWWWLPAVVAIIAAALIVLRGLGIAPAVAGAVGSGLAALSFGLSIGVLVHTYVVSEVCQDGMCLPVDQVKAAGASVGPAFGIWLTIVATAVLTYAAIAANKAAVRAVDARP